MIEISEAARALLLVGLALIAGFAWMVLRTLRLPTSSPDRLVAELRMAQFAAVMLALTAGASLGLTAANDGRPEVAIESAVALAFFAVATIAPLRDPREALTVLALAFCAHALADISHRPGLLPDQLAPRWFVIGCAIHNLVAALLCYLPVLRR
jgi:cytochrome bd-type quinol oxidase subunit 2